MGVEEKAGLKVLLPQENPGGESDERYYFMHIFSHIWVNNGANIGDTMQLPTSIP